MLLPIRLPMNRNYPFTMIFFVLFVSFVVKGGVIHHEGHEAHEEQGEGRTRIVRTASPAACPKDLGIRRRLW